MQSAARIGPGRPHPYCTCQRRQYRRAAPHRTVPRTRAMEHVEVFREAGRFGGWPANYGMYSFGDEIVLLYTV
jgi:hypothetical protein